MYLGYANEEYNGRSEEPLPVVPVEGLETPVGQVLLGLAHGEHRALFIKVFTA